MSDEPDGTGPAEPAESAGPAGSTDPTGPTGPTGPAGRTGWRSGLAALYDRWRSLDRGWRAVAVAAAVVLAVVAGVPIPW